MSQWMKDTLSRVTSLVMIYLLVVATFYVVPRGKSAAFNNGQATYTLGMDPCASSGYLKQTVSVSIASATTTQIVALSGTTTVYVCNWNFTINSSATTASSVAFEYGTGSSCGTGTTVLTGPMGTENAAAGAGILLVNGPSAGTSFSTPAGNALCLLTAGTTVALHGQVTFVQI